MVFQQLKLCFLTFVGTLWRAFCMRLSRRRKLSSSTDQLQTVSVIVGAKQWDGSCSNNLKNYVERDWNSWDERPRTVEEHIEAYRQRCAKPTEAPEVTEEPIEQKLFTELTPVIQPQLRYYLGDKNEPTEEQNFTRLQAQVDVPIVTSADLEDWAEDNDYGGWDELNTKHTKELLREKQREWRNQRQIAGKSRNANATATVQIKRIAADSYENQQSTVKVTA